MPAEPGHEGELSSRFGMLFLRPGSTLRGGFGAVAKVVNLYEESFALKRLNAPEASGACSAEELREMLLEEYKNQLAVSRLKGVPRVYGYGTWQGEPLILMEWIEGVTLAHAMPDLPHEGDGVPGEVVAQVGVSVLEILQGVERPDGRLVHRDISPNNIMFRTDAMSLSQQVAVGAFDTCLIDFGNSTTRSQGANAAFTQRVGVLRGATRDYAPPEMLTADVEGIEELGAIPPSTSMRCAACSTSSMRGTRRSTLRIAGRLGLPHQDERGAQAACGSAHLREAVACGHHERHQAQPGRAAHGGRAALRAAVLVRGTPEKRHRRGAAPGGAAGCRGRGRAGRRA